MKNIQKNKKSWFRGLVVAGVFAVSLLNLSIDSQRDAAGRIDLNITSIKAMAQTSESDPGGGTPIWGAPDKTQATVTCWINDPYGAYQSYKKVCNPGNLWCSTIPCEIVP